VVLSLRLTEAEVEKVVLDPKEYETSMWITPAELLSGRYHPALKFAVASLRAAEKLRELQAGALHMHIHMSRRQPHGLLRTYHGPPCTDPLPLATYYSRHVTYRRVPAAGSRPDDAQPDDDAANPEPSPNPNQVAVAAQPDDDAAIAALAREFAALARDAPAAAGSGTADYRVKSEALQYECGVEVSL